LLYNELKGVELVDFEDFTHSFCERSTFVALLRGNVVTANAERLANVMEEKMGSLGNVSLEEFSVRVLSSFPYRIW
jgi:hypothetical protein